MISRGGPEIGLPGRHPTIGGRFVATVIGDKVQLLDRNTLAPVAQVDAPGADAIAVSDAWLAYRAPLGGGDGIYIRYIGNPAAPAAPLLLASEGGASQLSPPAVDGNILLYAIATPRGSRVVQWVMGTHKHRALVRSPRLLLFNPAVDGEVLRLRPQRRAPQPADGSRPPSSRVGPDPLHPEALGRRALLRRAHRFRRLRDDPRAERLERGRHHRRVSVAGTRRDCRSARRAAAATTASSYQPARRRERPQRRLRVADRAVEGRARLGEQPAPADSLQIDHVVLDGDVLAIGEVVGDRRS